MKRAGLAALVASVPVLLLGVVWQSNRYSILSIRARSIETEEKRVFDENEKLVGSISVYSSKERINDLAPGLGMIKASPERRVHIVPAGSAQNSPRADAISTANRSALAAAAAGASAAALPQQRNGPAAPSSAPAQSTDGAGSGGAE